VEATYSLGISIGSSMILYTYLFTPLLSMMFIYLAHGMQPKTPVTNMRPYKVFVICSGIGLLVFLLLTDFMGYMSVPIINQLHPIIDLPVAIAVSLFITVMPAAIIDMKDSKRKASMERGVNNFLRDLTEVRKTGLSPEKCIESLANRDYGAFSKELRQISSKISWGVPARKVILDFIKKTKSWLTQIVMFLLVETMDVGGGTVSMIETIARFNNLTHEVEKEKKMAIRPYIMMPYFAAIMLVATTIMIIAFTGKTLGVAGTQPTDNLGGIITMFTTASIFHSYLIGIVAGKISEESIAAGFKHAAILVLVAVTAAKLMPIFVKF
jgi:flagellar protein FlaJ